MYIKFSPYFFTSKCILLLSVLILSVALVFASTGGGGGNVKKSTQNTKSALVLNVGTKIIAPFRATDLSFSQKNAKDIKFVGNLKMTQSTTLHLNAAQQATVISQQDVYKYKVGNTIYLVPNKTSYNVSPKNNFNAIDVKISF